MTGRILAPFSVSGDYQSCVAPLRIAAQDRQQLAAIVEARVGYGSRAIYGA
jgi:hypothetical protein